MLLKTRGIILRTLKYSETSLITDIFTEEKGLRSYIISGVRTPKAKVAAGLLQVTSLVDLVAYEKEEANKLNRIKEIKAAHVYTSLPFDVQKSSVAIFMAETARHTLKGVEINAPLFNFLFDIFKFLDETTGNYANLHLCFMLEMSHFLGFQPHNDTYTEGSIFDLKEGVFQQGHIGHSHFLDENKRNYTEGFTPNSLVSV
ncbi:MAG: DNA repair protein RecO [Saprospiraceae bacterium]|nr:DNA repair protein RecO [Saprospiraceae bacterium]